MVFSANQEELFSKIKEERDDLGDHVIGQLFLPTVICILRESGGSNIILKSWLKKTHEISTRCTIYTLKILCLPNSCSLRYLLIKSIHENNGSFAYIQHSFTKYMQNGQETEKLQISINQLSISCSCNR